jgi:hypothetical protein
MKEERREEQKGKMERGKYRSSSIVQWREMRERKGRIERKDGKRERWNEGQRREKQKGKMERGKYRSSSIVQWGNVQGDEMKEGNIERRNHGTRIAVVVAGILCLVAANSYAQLSGYASASYGYHSNPLYNSESLGDQLLQGYIEIQHRTDWSRSFLNVGYVGGLMLFKRIADRTYYEHNIQTHVGIAMGLPQPAKPEGEESSDEESGEEGDEETDRDSTGSYLDFGTLVGARHDKKVYREFNNLGVELWGTWRFHLGTVLIGRVTDRAGYRSYTSLSDLSNLTNQLLFEVGTYTPHGLSYGGLLGFGLKYFTKATYDTSLFASTEEIATKSQGKGKGGAKLVTSNGKKVLANGTKDLSPQLSIGAYVTTQWASGSMRGEAGFRNNLGTTSRYLAQYANTTILNEDIYNDHFNYEGPEAKLSVQQRTPGNLEVHLTALLQRKSFSAPALALDGTQMADNRIDLHGSVELEVTRYIQITEQLGLSVGINAGVVRNQSNDDYNDFTVHSIALSIGMGW